MSGKRRIVPVLVDDERVTEINLEYRDQDGYLGVSVVPVPPDDQATRDLHRLTNMVLNPEAYAMADPEKTREAAARLREWAGMDEGSE